VLGPIRLLWVVPRLGPRMAELLEAPIMFVVILVEALDCSRIRCATGVFVTLEYGWDRLGTDTNRGVYPCLWVSRRIDWRVLGSPGPCGGHSLLSATQPACSYAAFSVPKSGVPDGSESRRPLSRRYRLLVFSVFDFRPQHFQHDPVFFFVHQCKNE